MALYRLVHEEHGYHIAYNGAELKALETTGWKQISDEDFAKIIAAKIGDAETEDAPKKAGRPRKAT